ncbi:unnamed protein product [Didymodactylos carnosus]|uniref:GIY-YIG domain-containing protein n=1 Tax=Didymodactylos carnosus TaxID=1234261 RepID=A0A815KBM3_9BILA|nr:unnamed protein product [Didymodactylos carnosus]CAF1388933.1 unnamed protein product [Didymodactylos carnosus]CAF4184715.1 unnamed protein product [Didymodactylos carnosus]CAF4283677.1 unnamed protein product [Didymodactylos carnosus]
MAKTCADVDWPTTKDGSKNDDRFTIPQVTNEDGTRDMRYNLFEKPNFCKSEQLTTSGSNEYEATSAPHAPGVYQISTTDGPGRPTTKYTGMSGDLSTRIDQHGRGESNISEQMNEASGQGMNTRVQYSETDSRAEARGQEMFLLDQHNFDWNDRNNGGRD